MAWTFLLIIIMVFVFGLVWLIISQLHTVYLGPNVGTLIGNLSLVNDTVKAELVADQVKNTNFLNALPYAMLGFILIFGAASVLAYKRL